MPDPQRRNLSILSQVYDKAQEKYKSEKTDKSFVKWISEFILMNIEKDEFLQQYAPFLTKIGVQDNTLYIKDQKKNLIAEITMKNNQLYCSLDDTKDCMHIHFALALPELARLKK